VCLFYCLFICWVHLLFFLLFPSLLRVIFFLTLIPSILPSLYSFPFFPHSFLITYSLVGVERVHSVWWLVYGVDNWAILIRFSVRTKSLLQNLWSSSRAHAVWYSVGREFLPLTASTLHVVPRLRMREAIPPFPIRFNGVKKGHFYHSFARFYFFLSPIFFLIFVFPFHVLFLASSSFIHFPLVSSLHSTVVPLMGLMCSHRVTAIYKHFSHEYFATRQRILILRSACWGSRRNNRLLSCSCNSCNPSEHM